MAALSPHLDHWADNLLFDYESTGTETLFRDLRDPEPRSRRVSAFHRPEFLLKTLRDGTSLRQRLQALPGSRPCKSTRMPGRRDRRDREVSKASDPRALVQMATGAGKTFTACNLVLRLLAHAKAERVLFLVDRRNLGTETKNEFQRFLAPGMGSCSPNSTTSNSSQVSTSIRTPASSSPRSSGSTRPCGERSWTRS